MSPEQSTNSNYGCHHWRTNPCPSPPEPTLPPITRKVQRQRQRGRIRMGIPVVVSHVPATTGTAPTSIGGRSRLGQPRVTS